MTKFNTFATFLIEQDLFEDKVDVILSKQGDKLFSAYEQDKGADKPKCKDAKEVIDHLSEISKEYLQWLVTRYIAGQFYLEDKSKLEWVTQNFKKVAKKLEFNDINKYKDVANLETEMRALDPESQKSNKQINKEEASALEAEFIKKKKAIIYYDEGPIKVVIPKSVEASQYFGKGTRWCTAAENNNMFKSYSRGKDVLYIINLRGNKNKYQIHFKTKQFMDPEDRPVSEETLVDLCVKYPKLTEIFAPQAKEANFWPVLFTGEAMIDTAVRMFSDYHSSQHAINGAVSVLRYLIESKTMTDKTRKELAECQCVLPNIASKYGITSKEYKQLTHELLKTRDEKVTALVNSELVSKLYSINAQNFVDNAEAIGLKSDDELFVDALNKYKESKKGSSSYIIKFIVEMLDGIIDLPKELPANVVKAILNVSPDIYKEASFKLSNLNRIFPNLPEADKSKAVVAWAKELNNDTHNILDLIPAKWKSRTNWKPAVKI